MSNPRLFEVNLNSPSVYTIPSPSYTVAPLPHSFYTKDQWPANQTGVCFDPSHYSQNSCHTNLPQDTPYVIRTLPCDPICAPNHIQSRRRQACTIFCGCFILALPILIFFIVMSIVLTKN
uniref:Uncharacterized protein n=1 Tax=Panagrolaimus davidi TaxID=227884 RepID=A0A914PEF2_9BILA